MQKKIIPPAAAAILAWNKFRELYTNFQLVFFFIILVQILFTLSNRVDKKKLNIMVDTV